MIWTVWSFYLMMLLPLFLMSSKSWFNIWVVMEINSLSFLYWLIFFKKENLLVMFIFQTFSSMLFFLSVMWEKSCPSLKDMFTWTFMITFMSLMMKMGLFPFHMWVIFMSKKLNWINNLVMMTWQKIIPMLILMKTILNFLAYHLILLSMMTTSIMLMSTLLIKPILMLSSISNSSWMIAPILNQPLISMVYWGFYLLLLYPIIKWMLKHTYNNISLTHSMKMKYIFLFLSLGGIPPLIGFYCKWIVFKSIMEQKSQSFNMLAFIFSACMNFFIYISICYKNMTMSKKNWKMKKKNNMMKKAIWTLLPALFFILF